jgi:hypothetical protein
MLRGNFLAPSALQAFAEPVNRRGTQRASTEDALQDFSSTVALAPPQLHARIENEIHCQKKEERDHLSQR